MYERLIVGLVLMGIVFAIFIDWFIYILLKEEEENDDNYCFFKYHIKHRER